MSREPACSSFKPWTRNIATFVLGWMGKTFVLGWMGKTFVLGWMGNRSDRLEPEPSDQGSRLWFSVPGSNGKARAPQGRNRI